MDENGREVPKHEYDLVIGDEDFEFKLKNPSRAKSGKYTVVLGNDAGDAQEDVDVNFLGE